MTVQPFKRSFHSLDFLGVVACASILAFIQWELQTRSDEVPELRNLFKLLIINLACFAIPLVVVVKLVGGRLTRTLRLLLTAQLGSLAAAAFIELPFWYRTLSHGQGNLASGLLNALFFILLMNIIALLLMGSLCGLGILFKADMD